MELNKIIERINTLYHKRRNQGLTELEAAEEKELRRSYIDAVKGNLRGQLDQIQLVDPEPHCGNKHCDCKH